MLAAFSAAVLATGDPLICGAARVSGVLALAVIFIAVEPWIVGAGETSDVVGRSRRARSPRTAGSPWRAGWSSSGQAASPQVLALLEGSRAQPGRPARDERGGLPDL